MLHKIFLIIFFKLSKKYSDIIFLLDIKLSPFILIFTSIICATIISQKVGIVQIISILLILISLVGIIAAEILLRKKIKIIIILLDVIFFLYCNISLKNI